MFSGIISALGNVKNITYNDIYSVDIEITKINLEDFEKSDNLIKIGCSIACSGVCLTLTEKNDNVLTFDISKETMSKTNLSDWKIGSLVNLERALRVGDEIGGHFVTGHVDTVLELQNIIEEAIKKGGSSIKDYASPQDDLGYFQTQFQVYDREGMPCYYCKSLITRVRQGGRSTFFCIKCQN